MSELNDVEISMVIRAPGGGKQRAKISVEYNDQDWGDVLGLEKAVIPQLVQTLLAAGEAYNASLGIPPSVIGQSS